MAYVGRARARLDQGNKTGAAADAALVPAGFVINATAENAPPTPEPDSDVQPGGRCLGRRRLIVR